MNKQQLIIFLLVGVMMFSVLGTGILLITDSGNETESQSTQNNQSTETTAESTLEVTNPSTEGAIVCSPSADAANQAGNPQGDWPVVLTDTLTEIGTEDLLAGEGKTLEVGDCITAHYRLALADGTPVAGNDTFDSGRPFTAELSLGTLIEGWVQGLPGMKEGGVRRLTIPAAQGYGASGSGTIPPNSDLVFDVELVKIENR